MATPPFNIDETIPGDNDVVSAHPSNARTFRDVIESWISVEHDTYGRHQIGRGNTAARDAITTWEVGALWINTDETPNRLEFTVSIDPDVWVTLGSVTLFDTKVTGPGTVTDERIVLFDGTTGYLVKESTEGILATVTQGVAEAGTATDRAIWTAQRVKQAIDALAPAAVASSRDVEVIQKQTVSGVSEVDFTLDSDTYKRFQLEVRDLDPAALDFAGMRFRRDGQGSFDSGASDYGWAGEDHNFFNGAFFGDREDDHIGLHRDEDNNWRIDTGAFGLSVMIDILKPDAGLSTVLARGVYGPSGNATAVPNHFNWGAIHNQSGKLVELRIYLTGGSNLSGTFVLTGYRD